jgi:hypothetical protein
MPENTSAAKAAKPYSAQTEGAEAIREFAQQGASYTKDMYEKTKVAAEETNKLIERTYSTVAKSAADFNVQWIEMVRANTNSALDFSRQLVGVKSPSEFLNCRPRMRASNLKFSPNRRSSSRAWRKK